jgi:dynein heavy chain
VSNHEGTWKTWYEKDRPENEPIPDGYGDRLNTFNRLLMLRSWFPDRAIQQMYQYIEEALGEQFTVPNIIDISEIWQQSNNKTPLLGLLSTGCVPTHEIEQLAKKQKIGEFEPEIRD